jgi:alkylresorcinol/alkylpyrone synthase
MLAGSHRRQVHMPKICGVSVAVPPYRVTQQEAAGFAKAHFASRLHDTSRIMPVFENAGIETRYFSAPMEWLSSPHTLAEKNQLYISSATELSRRAVSELLDVHNLAPDQIDYIVYVNTTGLATPSIDARLINLLGMRQNIRRTPIWGLGCAGGAAGLSHGYHYLLGHPRDRVLMVGCELCGLTFMPDDFSKSNFIATALFGEGAAAVLMAGDEVDAEGVKILGTQSRFYPDSLDVMGWNVVSQGLQVVFAQRIPDIVAEHAEEDLGSFVAAHNVSLADIRAFLFHPGGVKVVEAYRKALNLHHSELAISEDILREYGNMSSVSVLFVLERYLRMFGTRGRGHVLLSALGPGFCSESLLFRS